MKLNDNFYYHMIARQSNNARQEIALGGGWARQGKVSGRQEVAAWKRRLKGNRVVELDTTDQRYCHCTCFIINGQIQIDEKKSMTAASIWGLG